MNKKYSYKDLDDDFFNSLIEKAKELLTPERIILFGSFARGDAGKKSDLDIAFDFSEQEVNWVYFKSWVDDEFRTLRELDLVDMKKADKSILESIEKEGVVLYER